MSDDPVDDGRLNAELERTAVDHGIELTDPDVRERGTIWGDGDTVVYWLPSAGEIGVLDREHAELYIDTGIKTPDDPNYENVLARREQGR